MYLMNLAGSSESAGIKALILAKGEEPFVKTLGITVLPGSHALVGMQLTEVGWKTDMYLQGHPSELAKSI